MAKRYCPKNHDTFVVGRYESGGCSECKKMGNRAHRNTKILNADGTEFTHLDHDRAYQIQQGKCGICGRHQSEFKRALAEDHDHITHIFRGLLCVGCNLNMGVKDDKEWNNKADKYLQTNLSK